MTDSRPKPQYGEYAPPGWVSPVPPAAPADSDQRAGSDSRAGSHSRAGTDPRAGARVSPQGSARPRRNWDLFLTVGLLAIGVFNVVSGFFSFRDLPGMLTELYRSQGIAPYTEVGLAHTVGTAISVSQVVVLLVTIWASFLALKKKRLAFYWPLVGFVVTMLTTLVLILVAMFGDPAFMTFVNNQSG